MSKLVTFLLAALSTVISVAIPLVMGATPEDILNYPNTIFALFFVSVILFIGLYLFACAVGFISHIICHGLNRYSLAELAKPCFVSLFTLSILSTIAIATYSYAQANGIDLPTLTK